MSKRDYYEVLGVSKTVEDTELKKAYRKVAMQFHPDRNPGDKVAEEKFKEAAEAYEILSDPDKRARYDRLGHAGVDGSYGSYGQHMNMDDIFTNSKIHPLDRSLEVAAPNPPAREVPIFVSRLK